MVSMWGMHSSREEDEQPSETSHLHLSEGDSPEVPRAPVRISGRHGIYRVIIYYAYIL